MTLNNKDLFTLTKIVLIYAEATQRLPPLF